MKRPAEEGHLQRTDTGRKCRVGYKDFRQLALALSPHVHERFFSNYTTDRNMKQIDKKRLCSRSFALFIVEEPVWVLPGRRICGVCRAVILLFLTYVLPMASQVLPGAPHKRPHLESHLEHSRQHYQESALSHPAVRGLMLNMVSRATCFFWWLFGIRVTCGAYCALLPWIGQTRPCPPNQRH